MKPVGDLKAALLEFVKERRHVSFAEIQREFPDETGEISLMSPNYDNILFWPNMSDNLAAAISELVSEGKIYYHATQVLTYLMDGVSLKLPVVKRARSYKKLHWLPLTIDTSPSDVGRGR